MRVLRKLVHCCSLGARLVLFALLALTTLAFSFSFWISHSVHAEWDPKVLERTGRTVRGEDGVPLTAFRTLDIETENGLLTIQCYSFAWSFTSSHRPAFPRFVYKTGPPSDLPRTQRFTFRLLPQFNHHSLLPMFHLEVPLALLAVLFALPEAIRIAIRLRRKRVRNRRRRHGLCLKCGYDMRGSDGCCPECGRAACRVDADAMETSAG